MWFGFVEGGIGCRLKFWLGCEELVCVGWG